MIRCPYCGRDEYSILYDHGYEIICECYDCDLLFEAQRNYPPYYIEDDSMEIKTISYKRTNNLGNYNSESLEMYAELDETDNPFEAAEELKDMVLVALGLKKPEVNTDQLSPEDTFSF